MAKIHVLGSSSEGNGYVIETTTGFLLLEAGIKPHDALKACKYDRSHIQGLCVSHVHQDHAKYLHEIADFGIPHIIAPDDVLSRVSSRASKHSHCSQWIPIGQFKVLAFPLTHDVPCYGYIVKHAEFGTLLFATDCMDIPTIFKGIDWFLIEANYSDELLQASGADQAQKRRVITSHMSLDYCIKYLHDCGAESSQGITLVHLSSRHSDADEFLKKVQQEFLVPTSIADKGVIIDISKELL